MRGFVVCALAVLTAALGAGFAAPAQARDGVSVAWRSEGASIRVDIANDVRLYPARGDTGRWEVGPFNHRDWDHRDWDHRGWDDRGFDGRDYRHAWREVPRGGYDRGWKHRYHPGYGARAHRRDITCERVFVREWRYDRPAIVSYRVCCDSYGRRWRDPHSVRFEHWAY